MIVGKTSNNISKTEIFTKYSEIQVLSKVFPEITTIPCVISSPLRVDNHPSFSIFMGDNNHIYYRDFADSTEKGSLLDLLCKYWKCSFSQVFDKILETMQGEPNEVALKSKQVKVLTRKETTELSKIQVAVRPWRDYDYEYWASYGVEKQWLKWAGVLPISHKIITKKDTETGRNNKYIFPADKLAYVFTEYKENKLSLKIYQPYNTKGFKWCSKMDSSVISLWTKIPEQGDRVVICSSLKDSLVISCQLHIPAICPQGEGYSISQSAVNELKRRYKKVFISFDVDAPGIQDAKNLSKKTGFPYIVPDLNGQKDYSDYYKSLENKEEFKQLETLFH